jgi:putative tryptophan/tyrosine transport system substrate-binding protein
MRLIGFAVIATLGVILALVAAEGQQQGRVPSIGFLLSQSVAASRAQDEAFRQGMRELGYVEGQAFTVERRYAEGNTEILTRLAAELIRLKVDIIVAPSSSAALAVKKSMSTVPVVFAFANDPVGLGLVASLARPGGNVTGLTPMSADLSAKRLELFKEAVPPVSRIAILSTSTYPQQSRQTMVRDLEAAARLLRMDIRVLEVKGRDELDAAFATMSKDRVGAVTALPLPFLTGERRRIAELALRNRLPSVFHWREYVEVGGLMSYGAGQDDLIRRAATYVDKILKGTKPADLPVEQPTKFELVINLKTAKALGLTIPQSILLRADQVIE